MNKTLSFVARLGLLCSILFSLSGCEVVGTGGVINDPYYGGWYDAFGRYCGGSAFPGCNYYSNGVKITIWNDPYYYGQTFTGFWTSPNGIMYDRSGYALNSKDDSETNDVLAQADASEKAFIGTIGKLFADRYALNEEASLMVATTLHDWSMIGKDRARTATDQASFLKRLYGVSMDKALGVIGKATLERNQNALIDLNADVAAHWGTSPEVSKQILKTWYARELGAMGN